MTKIETRFSISFETPNMACQWKDIEEYPGYMVSTDGCVKGKTGCILKPSLNNRGYPFINLCKDGQGHSKSIHRLVAVAFVQNPNNYDEIDHIDRDKLNNKVENLRWATRSQNLENKGIDNRNKSGVKGVSYDNTRQKWMGQMKKGGKKYSKRFNTKEEAVEWINALPQMLND